MKELLVSIITVTYNAAEVIGKTLDSIIKQDYERVELIVIDGVSVDGTLDIINKYKNEISSVIVENDKGIYDAMNKGIHIATGDVIYFLNAGDILHDSHVISEVVRKFDADIVYGDIYSVSENIIYNGRYNKYKLALTNPCHQSIFYSKKIFNNEGLFNIKYKMLADYEYNMRVMFKKIYTEKYIDVVIADYDGNGRSKHEIDEKFMNDRGNIVLKNLGIIPYILFKIYEIKKGLKE